MKLTADPLLLILERKENKEGDDWYLKYQQLKLVSQNYNVILFSDYV
jgi:predicted RNA-binding protein associated with RNAse of E/G family